MEETTIIDLFPEIKEAIKTPIDIKSSPKIENTYNIIDIIERHEYNIIL